MKKLVLFGLLLLPSVAHADRLGSLKNNSQVKLSSQTTPTSSVVGTTTNDDATAGNIGESLKNVASMTTPATGTYANICSVTLTAGDWMVHGAYIASSIGSLSQYNIAISTFTGNTTTDHVLGDNLFSNASSTSGNLSCNIPGYRVSVAGSTPVYLKCLFNYTGAAGTVWGRISAVRIR